MPGHSRLPSRVHTALLAPRRRGQAGILCEAAAERTPARRGGSCPPPSWDPTGGKKDVSSQAGQCLSPKGPVTRIKASCLARSRSRLPQGQEGHRQRDRWTSLSARSQVVSHRRPRKDAVNLGHPGNKECFPEFAARSSRVLPAGSLFLQSAQGVE